MISIQEVQQQYQQDKETGVSLAELNQRYLSRKGYIAQLFAVIKDLPAEQKGPYGQKVNLLKQEIESYCLQEEQIKPDAGSNSVNPVAVRDIYHSLGNFSPISWLMFRIQDIFSRMSFSVDIGPEIETEYYNFDALNIPEAHPARDVWDTIWINDDTAIRKLLRTHTSPVQIHHLENHKPPIRIIAPGKVYRYEATDATHETVFHQVEGLMLDKGISIASFKGVIQVFFQALFQEEIQMRLRPSYFPFTEPSFEIDIWIEGTWLEIAGAGMVHRSILKNAGIEDKDIQGFAFGFGLERLAMILYKIPDIRFIHSADIRFASQLGKTQL